MAYMERNTDLRMHPESLFPGVKSIIVLLANYYNDNYQPSDPLKVSRYAVGRDYHKVLKKKGRELIKWMQAEYGKCNARVFVDSAPVMEKEWARRAGLGWIGKNTCLIRPGEGSWFFIATIFTDLIFYPDVKESRNYCGNCSACVDACPTKAINPGGFLEADKCLSYLTIELPGEIPDNFKNDSNWLFGCDICQEVCPHNRFSLQTTIEDFRPREIYSELSPELVSDMNEEEFKINFAGSPLKRAGLNKLKSTSAFLYPPL